jgi:hypothetical protein
MAIKKNIAFIVLPGKARLFFVFLRFAFSGAD